MNNPRPDTTLDPAQRTRCEIYTRVMGYHRPIAFFNPGKRQEHADRRYFRESRCGLAPTTPTTA